jgi:hypothetical protein
MTGMLTASLPITLYGVKDDFGFTMRPLPGFSV